MIVDSPLDSVNISLVKTASHFETKLGSTSMNRLDEGLLEKLALVPISNLELVIFITSCIHLSSGILIAIELFAKLMVYSDNLDNALTRRTIVN